MSAVVFTPKPRLLTKTRPCSTGEVMEFRHYRAVTLTLSVIGFVDPSSPLLWVAMETSLYVDRDFGALGRFDSIATDGGTSQVTFDHVMRYVRWNVVRFDGATAAWFTLDGVAQT